MKKCHSIIKSPFFLLFLCFFGLSSSHLKGQSWENSYFAGLTDHAAGIYITETNNQEYLVTGWVNDNLKDVFVMRLDADGNELWTSIFLADFGFSHGTVLHRPSVVENADGDIFLAHDVVSGDNQNIRLAKLDADGQQIWEQEYGDGFYDEVRQILLTDNGDVLLAGSNDGGTAGLQAQVIRVDADGTEVWTNFYGTNEPQTAGHIVATSDGNFVISGQITSDNQVYLMKIDGTGAMLWTEIQGIADTDKVIQTIEDLEGNLITMTYQNSPTFTNQVGYVLKTTPDGQELWQESDNYDDLKFGSVRVDANNQIIVAGSEHVDGVSHFYNFSSFGDFLGQDFVYSLGYLAHTINTSDGGHITCGYQNSGNGIYQIMVIKVGSQSTNTNVLTGTIFDDENDDCLLNPIESGVYRWYVKANDGMDSWYGVADMDGNYSISLPAGTYEVTVVSPAEYWEVCQNSYDIIFSGIDETQVLDIPVQGIINCPVLEVQIGTSWDLRICEESKYVVSYCNYGTMTAEDAFVEITLEEYQSYQSSSIPFSSQNGDTYTFNLGDIEFAECSEFFLWLTLDCDDDILGYTHCVEAHIFPDSICTDPMAAWSGASVEVMGECVDGNVEFTVKNVGNAATTPTLNFIIIEDEVIYMQSGVDNLPPTAEELLVSIPANGQTYRLQMQQEPGHPGESQPTFFVEGCTSDNLQPISTGFVNVFPPDDTDIFVDVSCVQNNYPYDPNDKLAVPYGYSDEHFIHVNQQIEYTIRFQNTGTAEAFTVIVRDSLPATLDPTTLRTGASSHPYNFTMESNGIAVFTFENINLPDSTSNFEASQGFIKFDIRQQPDLPNGTVIENDAAIFFDLADPVITPKWFHTIGENFVLINDLSSSFKNLEIATFPNPFSTVSTIVLKGMYFESAELTLYDSVGKLVKTAQFTDNQVQLERGDLANGIYFFTIQSEGRFVGNGKLVVQ